MSAEEKSDTGKQRSGIPGEKILAGALYIVTAVFVLGFLWQSLAPFLLP